ncbi:hypothetical protein [Bartonella sp. F02]|uniref:hypothetical protein n=1 Tax=Bartonella sp. F02 TaxID=2967262 RepID=UPI0022A8EFE1|nr:hypothetical protein [Bartonella sp. F02]MCZ2328948.1 hypothetical protein [Bartonella sp. F02]
MKKYFTLSVLIIISTVMLLEPAMAETLSHNGILDGIMQRFHDAVSTWQTVISAAASRLFWSLALISMIWTFGMMALRKADRCSNWSSRRGFCS